MSNTQTFRLTADDDTPAEGTDYPTLQEAQAAAQETTTEWFPEEPTLEWVQSDTDPQWQAHTMEGRWFIVQVQS